MGAEREDTDSDPKRVGTEPGLGKASGATPAAAAVTVEEEAPPPVDFDALHAALGDPLEYEELSSGPAVDKGSDPGDHHGGGISESSGRSSATYSSARPRTIPPTRAPAEDPNAPAVIVATDTDTVPSAPPQMTVPLKGPPPSPFARPPGSNPNVAVGHPSSGPHGIAGHPSSGQHAAAQPPFTPQPFPAQGRGAGNMTMRMPDRPVNMRRGKTPTIVMRARGPSAKQKLVAFMAMLLLVTACGIAVIIWRKPHLVGLEPAASGTPSASASAGSAPANGAGSGAPANSASGASAAQSASASASVAGSASAKKGPKVAPVAPHTASSAPR